MDAARRQLYARAGAICHVNGDGKFDLLLQANDNNEYLRLSIG